MQIDRQIISLAYRFLRAKTAEQRATVDLETHYTKVSQHENNFHIQPKDGNSILFQSNSADFSFIFPITSKSIVNIINQLSLCYVLYRNISINMLDCVQEERSFTK